MSAVPPVVVDASVALKWAIREMDSPQAIALLHTGQRMLVPSLFHSEVTNVLWKRSRHSDPAERITEDDARDGLALVLAVSVEIVPSESLAVPALDLALETGCAAYDCEYLVLALQENAILVTADRKFWTRIQRRSTYARSVRFIGGP